ncbi:dihydrodipicolinate reductase, partial [mine drainage metagenome]
DPRADRPTPRVVVAGARGRLGRSFCEIAVQNRWTIHGVVGRRPEASETGPFGQSREGGSIPWVAAEGLSSLLPGADLYVGAVPGPVERDLLPQVAEAGVPAVVAGTGLTESDSAWIARIAARIPLVWEPNYSVGMTWLAGRLLGVALPPGFDRGILEVHHRGKADRPSGSARALVEALAPPGGGLGLGKGPVRSPDRCCQPPAGGGARRPPDMADRPWGDDPDRARCAGSRRLRPRDVRRRCGPLGRG